MCMLKSIPFCYLIGWSNVDKYYYGVRYKDGITPDTLWTSYFTSSKYVKECRELYGEPDIIQIRRTFDSADAAILWERKVLTRVDVLNDCKWLNKNVAGAYKDASRFKGHKHTEESKAKTSKSLKGRHYQTAESKAKIRAAVSKPFTIECSDGRSWSFTTIREAKEAGFKGNMIVTAKREGSFTCKYTPKSKIKLNPGDILTIK